MSADLLVPGFEPDADLVPVGDWHPARYTPSLTGDEDFTTEGDRLLAISGEHWRSPETLRFLLDIWQAWLIRHVLETYPPDWPVEKLRGRLRYRQVVISIARQNGKSIIAALLALFLIAMHVRGPRVVGMASVEEQAKIVYDRLRYAIEANPALLRELRPTETRGIHKRAYPHPRGLSLAEMKRRDRGAAGLGNGLYQILPPNEETAQGHPVSGGLYDELHLGILALWDAIVKGQTAQPNAILLGITTAGDDDSELLIRLYQEGEVALDGGDERFGFFVWEGADDELTEANVIAANPAIACGRIDLDVVMADARKLWPAGRDKRGVTGRDRVIRYTLNRFVVGSADSWASIAAWNDTASEDEIEHASERVYSLDRSGGWEWATIKATSNSDGIINTEIVAVLPDPDHDRLVAACRLLAARGPCAFALDRVTLAAVGATLKEDGRDVWALTASEMQAAAVTTAATIARRALRHPGDALTRAQMPKAKRRNTPEGWRISRTLSPSDIDAVIATVMGVYVASVRPSNSQQLF
ncbi:terminase large subunit [Nocardioides sp. InS609-2]|uniref:terminase large subunit domain-containing protein n=1 Tax=Nocardioides sp. InS609-2 TaxID=2760705 RepID=UPI0020BDECF1|nr:terminase large subunit [Nocardioides sp. InS609-2]